jgi:general secretion pathway protein G
MRRIILRFVVALLAVIIVVVGAISYRAITSHRISVLRTREAVLQADLLKMRKLIDQYAADKGSLPESLDQLVSAGYLREIPEDPFTGQRDWVVVVGHDPNLSKGGEGIIDVHSASSSTSRERTPYKKW